MPNFVVKTGLCLHRLMCSFTCCQLHRARRVGAGCGVSCRLRCGKLLNQEDRQRVFDQFWALDDQQKWHFYAIYVERWHKVC
jgi:hypothetical protein